MKTLICVAALVGASQAIAAEKPVAHPLGSQPAADRVELVYFHRAQRCPTCKRIGTIAEEAISDAFASGIESGSVVFRYVDFQDPANATETRRYKVTTPTLFAIRVENNEPVHAAKLAKVWALVGKTGALRAYVVAGATAASNAETE